MARRKKKRPYPERHLLPDPANQCNILTWILKIGNSSGKELWMFDQMTLLTALLKDIFTCWTMKGLYFYTIIWERNGTVFCYYFVDLCCWQNILKALTSWQLLHQNLYLAYYNWKIALTSFLAQLLWMYSVLSHKETWFSGFHFCTKLLTNSLNFKYTTSDPLNPFIYAWIGNLYSSFLF